MYGDMHLNVGNSKLINLSGEYSDPLTKVNSGNWNFSLNNDGRDESNDWHIGLGQGGEVYGNIGAEKNAIEIISEGIHNFFNALANDWFHPPKKADD